MSANSSLQLGILLHLQNRRSEEWHVAFFFMGARSIQIIIYFIVMQSCASDLAMHFTTLGSILVVRKQIPVLTYFDVAKFYYGYCCTEIITLAV